MLHFPVSFIDILDQTEPAVLKLYRFTLSANDPLLSLFWGSLLWGPTTFRLHGGKILDNKGFPGYQWTYLHIDEFFMFEEQEHT